MYLILSHFLSVIEDGTAVITHQQPVIRARTRLASALGAYDAPSPHFARSQ